MNTAIITANITAIITANISFHPPPSEPRARDAPPPQQGWSAWVKAADTEGVGGWGTHYMHYWGSSY